MEESKIIINDILVHEDLQKNKNKKNPAWSMELEFRKINTRPHFLEYDK